ncbi:hypothetical protein PCE1_004401 [Barthelona sp. PCE]
MEAVLKDRPGASNTALIVVTHDGKPHSDDVLACAILKYLFNRISVTRTRRHTTGDIFIDVGGIYDGVKHFDHHQNSFDQRWSDEYAEKMASAGLIWKTFHRDYLLKVAKDHGLEALIDCDATVDLLANKIYNDYVYAVDADDNGLCRYEGLPNAFVDTTTIKYRLNNLIAGPVTLDKAYMTMVDRITEEFALYTRFIIAKWLVSLNNIRQAILDRFSVHESGHVIRHDSNVPLDVLYQLERDLNAEILFIMSNSNDEWRLKTVTVEGEAFVNRKSFPEEWGGLRNEELSEIAEIPLIFCHANVFLVVSESEESLQQVLEVVL